MSKFDIQWTPWNTSKKAKLGVWLLICCETCTGLINTVNRKLGKNQTPKYVEATKATLDWIEKVNSKEEILSPLYWPTIIQPRKWKGVYNGGYWNTVIKQLPLIKTRNTNLLEEYNNRTDEMASMYQAVNHIQDTPWRINKNLYNLLKEIKEKGLSIGKLPPMEPLEEPISPVPDKDATEWLANPENKERFIHFKREKERIKTYNVRTQSKRIAVSKGFISSK
jgi:DNA-directed RNA polymerase